MYGGVGLSLIAPQRLGVVADAIDVLGSLAHVMGRAVWQHLGRMQLGDGAQLAHCVVRQPCVAWLCWTRRNHLIADAESRWI